MEKKDEEKKIDSKSSWAQVVKSGQLKAPSTSSAATSSSGSSFAGAAAGGAWASSGAASGGAWGSSGAAGGGAWGSSESHQQPLHLVPPAWPSRTPYKSVPQRSGPETWKPSGTNDLTSRPVPFDTSSRMSFNVKPPPYSHVEPSPTPEVRQTSAFPSVWSPSTARKVTKKSNKINLFFFEKLQNKINKNNDIPKICLLD